jgi:hypothetical protein
MNEDASLRTILARVERLERAVFSRDLPNAAPKKVGNSEGSSLPDYILKLCASGFFDSPKTASEVHARLNSDYPCESNRVAMALLRMQRRRELRKSSKTDGGRKAVAYVR